MRCGFRGWNSPMIGNLTPVHSYDTDSFHYSELKRLTLLHNCFCNCASLVNVTTTGACKWGYMYREKKTGWALAKSPCCICADFSMHIRCASIPTTSEPHVAHNTTLHRASTHSAYNHICLHVFKGNSNLMGSRKMLPVQTERTRTRTLPEVFQGAQEGGAEWLCSLQREARFG